MATARGLRGGRPARLVALAAVALLLLAGCSGRTTGAKDIRETSATLTAVGSCDTTCSAHMRWREVGTTTWTNAPAFDVPNPVRDTPWQQQATGLSPGRAYEYQACGKEASHGGFSCAGPDGTGPTTDRFSTASSGRQPPGFSETTAFSGLTNPTAVRFARDGRVFIAEKSGIVKVFDGLGDGTATVFADLRTKVHNFWDRGLLGLALHPDFPSTPWLYVLYAHDAAIGGTAPRWGSPGQTADPCPTPPGPTTDGCVASGRLSRLQAAGNTMTGAEQVLVEDWCQQYPSHAVGDLAFGPDGALYVSAGDGANFNTVDFGQLGGNPCADPPREGGALRSQSVRRPAGEPRLLDGTVLRVDPATGAGAAGNPLASSGDANARRILAAGLRNPFRMAFRPGTNELWVGDVGWSEREEIDRIADVRAGVLANFGWPCFEGAARQPAYEAAGLALCQGLYGQAGAATAPFFSYRHADQVVPGEACPSGSSSTTGLEFEFYGGGPYPSEYDGALFFADHARNCIWAMRRGGSALPSPSQIRTFVAGAANPVDLELGPGGDLFYVDLEGGTIRRIVFTGGNAPPVAVARATPTSGAVPLGVTFDGTGSSDPNPGDTLSYAWDLDGNGTFGDSTAARPSRTYSSAGTYRVGLRVTDQHGATGSTSVTITAGNTPPTASIAAPSGGLTWAVGDRIAFSGSASDAQDGPLPASALSWSLVLRHCPSDCHSHTVQDFAGVSGGAFNAPDHEHPSHLELRLTATDATGLRTTTSVRLDPKTVALTLASSPTGLSLSLNGATGTAPFTRTVILGSRNTLTAPASQTLNGRTYDFRSWSDGGAASHLVTATGGATYTASYRRR